MGWWVMEELDARSGEWVLREGFFFWLVGWGWEWERTVNVSEWEREGVDRQTGRGDLRRCVCVNAV